VIGDSQLVNTPESWTDLQRVGGPMSEAVLSCPGHAETPGCNALSGNSIRR